MFPIYVNLLLVLSYTASIIFVTVDQEGLTTGSRNRLNNWGTMILLAIKMPGNLLFSFFTFSASENVEWFCDVSDNRLLNIGSCRLKIVYNVEPICLLPTASSIHILCNKANHVTLHRGKCENKVRSFSLTAATGLANINNPTVRSSTEARRWNIYISWMMLVNTANGKENALTPLACIIYEIGVTVTVNHLLIRWSLLNNSAN